MTPPEFAILGDSALAIETRIFGGKVIRARKRNETQSISTSVELEVVTLAIQRAMPSKRQSAKWGIRCFQWPFDRICLSPSADSATRKRLLTICVCLLNALTRLVGLN